MVIANSPLSNRHAHERQTGSPGVAAGERRGSRAATDLGLLYLKILNWDPRFAANQTSTIHECYKMYNSVGWPRNG